MGNSGSNNWRNYQDFLQFETPQPGDLLEFSRIHGGYCHWAVYEGYFSRNGYFSADHWVIHFSGEPADKRNAMIRSDRLSEVVDGCFFRINNSNDTQWTPKGPKEILDRARSQLNKAGYHLGVDNCEHFVNWCRYGKHVSRQIGLSFWDYFWNGPTDPLRDGEDWLRQRELGPPHRQI